MNDIEEVKSRLDIVDVVGGYVPLKRAGRSYKAPCPFHKEKTPSFIVTPEMQRFKCFGCGEGGDVISFIQKIERLEFVEALKLAAEKAGYELQNQIKKDDKLEKQKSRLYELNELAAKYWNYILKTHKAGKLGRDYLQKRGVRPQEIDAFMLGYAPKGDNLLPFLLKKGFTQQELISAGLAVERKGEVKDKFRERFMMSIMDNKGNIVAFSGRITLPNEYAPKYLNSPETLVYHKGDVLMGLYQAKEAIRKQKSVILQEGNIDLLSSHRAAVANIVATGGTALTEKQVKLLKRYADVVLFAFDNDSAGVKAMVKGVEFAEALGIAHKVIDLRPFKDPDEVITQSQDMWKEKVANPVNSVDYLFDLYAQDLDLGNPDDKSRYAKLLVPVLESIKDPVQRSHFADQLGMAVGTSTRDIEQMISGGPPRTQQPANHPSDAPELDRQPITEVARDSNKREIYLLALMLQFKNPQNLDVSGEVFTDVNAREIFNRLMQLEGADENFEQLITNLSDGAAETLQKVFSTEVDEIENFEQEFIRIYKLVYSNYLRSQILNMRRNLQQSPESEDMLNKLQFFTTELKSLNL